MADYDWVQMDKQLREPFPPDRIGLLPKPYKKDSDKGNCTVCGKYHGLPALHLDYVGHGAITERLLEVDPNWSWEPMGLEDGLPKIIQRGNDLELWIKLTIGDRTKLGVGSCPKDQFDAAKVLIGDALRNAAMRFGMALDLWIKGEGQENSEAAPKRPRSGGRKLTPTPQSSETPPEAPRTNGNGEAATTTTILKRELLEAVNGDKPRATMIWRETVGNFGYRAEDQIPDDMKDAIGAALLDRVLT